VGCGNANGTRDCGCGAAKVADDGEQDCGGVVVSVSSGEEIEEAKYGRASG
jgi:hypothetical protein